MYSAHIDLLGIYPLIAQIISTSPAFKSELLEYRSTAFKRKFFLALTDEGSSVIYKIVKINNAPLSILNDFVKPSKKEKK